ncbi:ig-like domain-containing protein [Caerostris extrusa]|uniref:Ig-like domain-containing protein n=1 Tax=Caerostris extrusa TaxID=172846 RepID=A0AAV4X0G3_CAEEX|nr:ig-like domain-containing protein [Caerostris extrusa]
MQRFQIELRRSNATHAFLNTSDLDTEGTYGCEVSTEVPSFRTIKAGKELRVHGSNILCFHSQPSSEEEDGLLISESRLNFALEPPRLWQGSLSVRCLASLSQVHATSSLELIVGEGTSGAEFQRILHVPPGQEGPVITGGLPRYYVGDIVDVNCSSARSLDLPRLSGIFVTVWNLTVRAEFLTPYQPTHYPDGLSSTKLGLRFRVLPEHLRGDEIRLKCTATLSYVITRTSPETILMGDNHRSSSFHTSDRSGTGK